MAEVLEWINFQACQYLNIWLVPISELFTLCVMKELSMWIYM